MWAMGRCGGVFLQESSEHDALISAKPKGNIRRGGGIWNSFQRTKKEW